jgi:endonuclease YncB( thermonuclease family)
VAKIIRNGRSINLAMVQSGQSFTYCKHLAACDAAAHLAAKAAAQRSRRGSGF